jgi:hypothetical protein
MSVITIGKCGSKSGICKPKQSVSKKMMKKTSSSAGKAMSVKPKKQAY